MAPQRQDTHQVALGTSRRRFIHGALLAAGATALPYSSSARQEESNEVLVARADEKARYLAFFDPADGPVPNPGMGVSGYVHSDHMYEGYPGDDLEERKRQPPLTLDRGTFNKLIELPYVDNLYLRYEWRDMQRQKGKLQLPDAWKWVLEASEKHGKRWSFRIMNCMKGSMTENSLPEFLQGKLEMIPYWNDPGKRGPSPKYFPEYSNAYLDYWGDFVRLLGEAFDEHPHLEYVDVSGYGFWGEFHHYARYSPGASPSNYFPDKVDAVIDRLIRDHLAAFLKTPAVLNLHAADFGSGQRAFEQGLVWARRDSFRYNFSTFEVRLAQGLRPGNGMVWEIIRPGIYCPVDPEMPTRQLYQLPQRYFDVGAHYVAMGFNPWDTIWAHEHCRKTYEIVQQNIGYRIRPSIVWHRKMNNKNEIVLGLRNDGCSGPPGQLTIEGLFPDGRRSPAKLPAGEPKPGAMMMYALSVPEGADQNDSEKWFDLSMKIEMKGKTYPVQWAVKRRQRTDPFILKVQVKPS